MICKSLHAHVHTRALCVSHRRCAQNSRALLTVSRASTEKAHVTWDTLHLGTMPLAGLEMLPWVPPVVQLHSFVVLSSSQSLHEVRLVISQSLAGDFCVLVFSEFAVGLTQFRCLTQGVSTSSTEGYGPAFSDTESGRKILCPLTSTNIFPQCCNLYFTTVFRPLFSICIITARLKGSFKVPTLPINFIFNQK